MQLSGTVTAAAPVDWRGVEEVLDRSELRRSPFFDTSRWAYRPDTQAKVVSVLPKYLISGTAEQIEP